MQGDKEICLAAGMDDYISKPIKIESVVAMLEKWAIILQQRRDQFSENTYNKKDKAA
jgi:CheY-like chemotaxis protein